ncbi:hypothetical protein BTZ20_4723 [Rhodococcus sp. MTM3W5.2]|nr:hypothetical protein BTZ20_4723 [Rhodococcus sp. MTM3W5.2]
MLINGLVIGLLFVALAAAAAWLDKRLPAKQGAAPTHTEPAL